MTAGRKAIPAKIHQLKGTYRPDRHEADSVVSVAPGIPDLPDGLDDVARAEWAWFTKELFDLGIIAKIDKIQMEQICVVYSRWKQAEKIVEREGFTIETKNGYPVQNPSLNIANQCIKQLQSLCGDFGLSPAARAKMKISSAQPQQLDLYADFLNKKRPTAHNG